MRKLARSILVVLLIAAGAVAIPRPADQIFTSEAQAQILPTPTLPPILPGDEDDDDDPGILPGDSDDEEDPTDGDNGGTTEDPVGDDDSTSGGDKQGDGGKKKDKDGDRGGRPGGNIFVGNDSRIAGAFSTDGLVAAAARLRALGMPLDEVISEVYAPFIIGGPAAWSDTWGAPRFGPGSLVRTHEGQDVFCRYGDPVLAPEPGVVSYSEGGLGGVTARVHTSTSSYWFLTHLSATNAKEIPAGSAVEVGDVIGFCGNSGNAITTPPHVHFGWYVNGDAVNPMKSLVKWLQIAERRVLGKVTKVEKEAVRESDARLTQRLFGDAFAPDLSELTAEAEQLLALKMSGEGGFDVLTEELQLTIAGQLAEQLEEQTARPSNPKAEALWNSVKDALPAEEHEQTD